MHATTVTGGYASDSTSKAEAGIATRGDTGDHKCPNQPIEDAGDASNRGHDHVTDEISKLVRLDESTRGLSDLLHLLWELHERLAQAERTLDDTDALRRRIAELETGQTS